MPSPIGHALAGIAVAWSAELISPRLRSSPAVSPDLKLGPTYGKRIAPAYRLTLLCATLAVLPDIDLFDMPLHRSVTHSVGAVLTVFIVATGVTGWVTRRLGKTAWLMGGVCAAAWGSHLVMDWLGLDARPPYGIQALWPFSDRWFIAPFGIFPGTERREPFSAWSQTANFRAVVWEVGIIGPIVAVLAVMRTRRTHVRSSVPDARPRPSGAAGDRDGTSDRPGPRAEH
jgi:membrane-bound metal-dependent hydrolase YbcI (DUF457 family)